MKAKRKSNTNSDIFMDTSSGNKNNNIFAEVKYIEKKMNKLNSRYNQLRVEMGLKPVKQMKTL